GVGPLDGVATLVGDRLWSSTSDGPRVQRRRRTRRRWSSRYRRARGSCCHLGGGAVAGPGGAVGENVLEGGRGHHLAGAVASPMVVDMWVIHRPAVGVGQAAVITAIG